MAFTDMVGYTTLIQADERLAVDRRDRYWPAVDRHHLAFGGTIVQRLGDGSMGMFPSALAAVQAAVEIQRELAVADVPVRIGIHAVLDSRIHPSSAPPSAGQGPDGPAARVPWRRR